MLDNAIKYTPDGGEVRIRAGAGGPQAFVVVKDTGHGHESRRSARARSTTRSAVRARVASGTRGKGLGLAVTKEILEANGGKISLSSEAGYGSEVTILLPSQRGRAVKRIVVVDDDAAVSGAVRELLAPEGFAVDCPPDPRDGARRRDPRAFRTSSSST